MELMYRNRKEEWDEEDLPALRSCERYYAGFNRKADERHHKGDYLWMTFDYTTCIGDEGYLISSNDARTAMDFYWLYASEAVRNFKSYPDKGFELTGWEPTLGLIRSCVLMARLLPDVSLYQQAQAGEHEWLRQVLKTRRGFRGNLPTDYDQLSIARRGWKYSSNSKEYQDFDDVLATLKPSQEWSINGDDEFAKLVRKDASSWMPLWRYSRRTNRQSYHDYMTLQTEAEIRAQEQALKTVDYYIPPQHRDPDTGRLVTSRPPDFVESGIDSSIGINEIRELLVNLNLNEKRTLANEIWNEV
jgi:hypothetical protein